MLSSRDYDLSQELKIDADQRVRWQEILDYLSPYTVEDLSGRPILLTGSNPKKIVPGWGTLAVWPASQIGIGQDENMREAALNTYQRLGYEEHPFVPPALARVGYDPEKLLEGIRKQCANRGYPNGYINFNGGGVETPSIIPATIDEMLLQSFTGDIAPVSRLAEKP